jgi:hypothetical protein
MQEAKILSPMLAPSDVVGIDIPIGHVPMPRYTSIKLNGVRGILLNGTVYSRSMKPLNIGPQLASELAPLARYCREHDIVLDGEFHSYSDNTVGGCISILAGNRATPYDFKYKVFGLYSVKQWNGEEHVFFKNMLQNPGWSELSSASPSPLLELVVQEEVHTTEELQSLCDSLQDNPLVEGLMLTAPNLTCCHRRVRANEATFLKLKFYSDPIDAKIVGLTYRREHRDTHEAARDELGYAKRSRREEDMEYTLAAGTIEAQVEDRSIVLLPFPKGTSLAMRYMYMKHLRKGGSLDLMGRWVQFRHLSAGQKDKPSGIRCVEFRDSKD